MQAKGENGDAVIDKSSANRSISPDLISAMRSALVPTTSIRCASRYPSNGDKEVWRWVPLRGQAL